MWLTGADEHGLSFSGPLAAQHLWRKHFKRIAPLQVAFDFF